MSIVVVGANHASASLDLLERMAISSERLPKLLHALDGAEDVSEVVVLGTCNRTEVYLVAEKFHGAYAQVRDFFSDLTFLPPDVFTDSLYVHYDDRAVEHLFDVAAGLDSAVPGEHEILGQVRTAWELARAQGTSRRTLNMLFRHAIEVGKRARSETRIAHHVTSVSQAAVIMAGERLAASCEDVDDRCIGTRAAAGLAGRRALVIGAGAMSRGMAGFLADAGVAQLVLANRTRAKAEQLADSLRSGSSGREHLEVSVVDVDGLEAALGSVDLLCTATDAPEPVLTVPQMREAVARRSASLLVVDVAMPRDLDPAAAELDGVEVLDMAAVAAMTEANLAARHAETDAVHAIVAEELGRFAAAVSARAVAPVVTSLREHAEGLRRAELERYAAKLDELDPEQRSAVDAMTKAMFAKLLHDPTVALKDAAGSSRGDRLADSVRDLFDLG